MIAYSLVMTENPGLDGVLGVEYAELSATKVVATWTVGPQHLQPFGIVHGGVYCSIHESAASIGSQIWLDGAGIAVGVNNNTDFLRQAGPGEVVTTTAVPIHQGRKQQLWRMESVTAAGKTVAIGQVRIQNLDTPMDDEVRAGFEQFVASKK